MSFIEFVAKLGVLFCVVLLNTPSRSGDVRRSELRQTQESVIVMIIADRGPRSAGPEEREGWL